MKFNAETVIKLMQVKGIGRGKVFKLSDMIISDLDDLQLAEFVSNNSDSIKIPKQSVNEIQEAFNKGKELLEKSISDGIKSISYSDIQFPVQLRNITNPPAVIHVKGNLEALSMPSIAVIGTRQPSAFGRTIGERVGYRLGESKINVVSGLAVGCDTAGHIGCLKAGGVTTAVLAHGLDTVYPKENAGLLQAILTNNGCVLSEYMIKTKGHPNFFIERDRIQAGLSKATVVVETDIKGGTMHTVGNTLEYNRILAAFCHAEDKKNEKSRGNEMLIRERKAMSIATQKDIDDLIRLVCPDISNNVVNHQAAPIENIAMIQLKAFDIEMYTVPKEKKPRKPKSTKKKKADDESSESPNENITQTKLYGEE